MERDNDAGAKTGVCYDNGEQETLPSLSFVGSLQYRVQPPLNTSNAINVRELRGCLKRRENLCLIPEKHLLIERRL